MHQTSNNPMRQMKYSEYLAFIFGNCFIALAPGICLSGKVGWMAVPAIGQSQGFPLALYQMFMQFTNNIVKISGPSDRPW
jgi:hypothetical protein